MLFYSLSDYGVIPRIVARFDLPPSVPTANFMIRGKNMEESIHDSPELLTRFTVILA
jgi:hypothetical protein